MEELSVQALLLASSVAGGVFALANGLIRVLQQVISERRGGREGFTSEDRAMILSGRGDLAKLLNAVVIFEKSHADLSQNMHEIGRAHV